MPLPRVKSLKRKVALLAVGAVALTVLLMGLALVYVLDRYVSETVSERLNSAYQDFQMKVAARAESNLMLATSYSRATLPTEAMRTGNREMLLNALSPIFQQLRADFSVDNIHFHTPDGRTFLRLHEPSKFGDMLADKRPMIAKVNTERAAARGIEWGVHGLVIRGMRAIVTNNGEHLGSVEVGSFITDQFLTGIAPPNVRLTVYSNKPETFGGSLLEQVQRLAASGGRTGAKLLPDDLVALTGLPSPIRPQTLHDGKTGLTRVYPLSDWSGQIIGAIQICVDADDIHQLRTMIGAAVVALGLLGMVIAYLLARQLSRTVTVPIMVLSESIGRIAEDDLDTQVPNQRRDDEIGHIARRLDALRQALILARRKEVLLRHRDRLQSLGDMTGRIAHEINNLLQPIRLTVEMLEDAPDAQPVRAQINTIGRTVERARVLIAEILGFARRDPALGMPAEAGSINLDEAMWIALRLVQASLQEDQKIDTVGAWPHQSVRCDAAGLSQVLLNICRNGFDAMGGKGTIHIDADALEISSASSKSAVVKPGNYIRISIHDHGPGIPPEIMDRLFEPFFTTKPAGKGTGLGLSIAYSMVLEWGGHIGVQSKPGVGTTFEIYLVVADASAAAHAARAPGDA